MTGLATISPATSSADLCTEQRGFCGIYGHYFSFKLSLLPSRIHALPSARDENRYAAILNYLNVGKKFKKEHKEK